MKNILRNLISVLWIAAISISLYSCYPEEASTLGDLDVIVTNYDTTYNFSRIQTYIMPDTIVPVTDDNGGSPIGMTINQTAILNAVATNMANRGYTRVYDTIAQKPDVAILLNGLSNTYWGTVWYDWWYYWGWYPYFPPYWDGYYPYYPWGSVTYSYTVGTLLMQMIDFQTSSASDSLNVIWIGAINGVLEESNSSARIQADINQAFNQSPYL